MNFFFEVLIGGLLSGVMYALVALGFVLIYKASGVFNFAQGAMVYLAALSVVGVMEWGVPLWLAVIFAFVIMTLFGIATEKFVLRKLVNQPPSTRSQSSCHAGSRPSGQPSAPSGSSRPNPRRRRNQAFPAESSAIGRPARCPDAPPESAPA